MAQLSDPLAEAISRIVYQSPFFAVYLYDQMRIVETNEYPTAATDGKTIWFNPEFMGSLDLHERVFVICHEILHGIYLHMSRGKGYEDRGIGPDNKRWVRSKYMHATDYVINATLIASKVGKMPEKGLYDPQYTSAMTAEEVYCKLPDSPERESGGQGEDKGGGDGFDDHVMPQNLDDMPTETTVKRAIMQATAAAKAQGKMPAALDQAVNDIMGPKISWREQLREVMTETRGHEAATWARLNRRKLALQNMIYPGANGYEIGTLAVVVDTSGSVSTSETQTFLGEIMGIAAECRPKSMFIFWTDSRVSHVDEIDDYENMPELRRHGGGGTDMPAAFDYIEENDIYPEHCVVLTDGWTDYGEEQAYKTTWVITSTKTASHGTTIHLEVGA